MAGFIAVLAGPAIAADDSVRLATMSEGELEAGMKAGVQAVLRRVPMVMEDRSVLVGAEYEATARLATYHYVPSPGADLGTLRARVISKNCATPNTRAMMDRGITFRHLYQAGGQQFDFSVRSGDCQRLSG